MGGFFCPTDGFIAPLQILRGYLDGAARHGVRAEWNTGVRGFRLGKDRITSVETDRGWIDADVVVNAAGAWAGVLGEWADVTVPVTPLRRQVAATVPCNRLPRNMPMTIFAGDGFHFRVRDERVLLLWPSPGVPGRVFELGVDPDWISAVTLMAHERVPVLQDVPVDTAASWAGLYEMSPDKHAILGRAPGLENFYLINGSSGHGVMHAPALGGLLAELVSDGKFSSLDATALRPSRFAEGAANPVSGLL
jgi:sarcosine oxidase subunit beta